MRRSRISAPCVLAAAWLLVARSPLVAQATRDDRSERPEVRSLVLKGVHGVDPKELRASIQTSADQCKSFLIEPFCLISRHSPRWWTVAFLDHTEPRRDVLRIKVFYWKRGYRETAVDTAV